MHTDEPANALDYEQQRPHSSVHVTRAQLKWLGRVERLLRWSWFILLFGAEMQYISLSNRPTMLVLQLGLVIGLAWLTVFWVTAGLSRAWARAAGVRGAIAVVMFALVFSGLMSRWPFHVAFALSRPFLDRVATKLESGRTISTPRLCGLLLITEAGTATNGTPCLFMSHTPSGWTGLVRHPASGKVDHINSNNGGPGMLTDRWELVDED